MAIYKTHQQEYLIIHIIYMQAQNNSDEKEIIPEAPQQPPEQQEPPIVNKPPVASQHAEQYLTFFNSCHIDQLEKDILNFEVIMGLGEGVQFVPSLYVQIGSRTPNGQVVNLNISTANFMFRVSVLSDERHSFSHRFGSESVNKDNHLFLPNSINQAIKCFSLGSEENQIQMFGRALKEYCFLKMAEKLGVGPKMNKIFGFDLVFFKECVQFSMERCVQLKDCISLLKTEDVQGLKKKLKILHAFQIVHEDIKPLNIMYSPYKKTLVFIDFGFSRVINQDKGFKSQSNFSGTYSYCSEQMKKNYSSKLTSIPVDLYYNDLHGLLISIKEIYTALEQYDPEDMIYRQIPNQIDEICENNSEMKAIEEEYKEKLEVLKLKEKIFCNQLNLTLNNIYQGYLIKYCDSFVSFLSQLQYSKSLQEVYLFMVNNANKGLDKESSINMQVKKQQIIEKAFNNSDKKEDNQQSYIFKDKLDVAKDETSIKMTLHDFPICFNFIPIKKKTIKESLKDPKTIQKMKFHYYLVLLARTVDLQSSMSTYEEKKQLCKIFIEYSKLNEVNIKIKSQFVELEKTFKFLLHYFISTKKHSFQEIIPLAMINLIILEGLQSTQIRSNFNLIIQIKSTPALMGIMLFRLNYIRIWMKIKDITEYNQNNLPQVLKQIIKRKLQQILIQTENGDKTEKYYSNFIMIILKIISSIDDDYFIFFQEFSQYFNYLRNLFGLKKQSKDELLSFLMTQVYRRMRKPQQIKVLDMIKHYRQYKLPIFQNPDTIHCLHLRIWQFLSNQKYSHIATFIMKKFIKCLQHPKLIVPFLSIHLKQKQQNKQQFIEVLQFLSECLSKKQYKYNVSILKRVQYLLQNVKIKPQKSMEVYYKYVRKVINCEYLKQFLNHYQKDQHLIKLIHHLNLLSYFICKLYTFKAPEFQSFYILIDKTKQKQQEHVCLKCKQNNYISLQQTQAIILWHSQNYIKLYEVCVSNLKEIIEKQYNLMIINYYKQIFTEFAMNSLLKMEQNEDLYRWKELYVFCQKTGYFSFIFIKFSSKITYYFAEKYSLIVMNDANILIKFHQNIQKGLINYPTKQYIQIYYQHLIKKTILFQLPRKISNQIMRQMFKESPKKLNAYMCLFLRIFLDLCTETKYIPKIILAICKRVDFVVVQAKKISLEGVFPFVYETNLPLIPIDRSFRRKMLHYSHYLTINASYSEFIKKLRLPRFLKRRHDDINVNALTIKMKQFYKAIPVIRKPTPISYEMNQKMVLFEK